MRKRRCGEGHVARKGVKRLERRKRRGGPPCQFVDVLGTLEAAESMLAEVLQRQSFGESIAHELRGDLRQDDLPAVRSRHEPTRTVQGEPEVVAVTLVGLAG